MTRRVSLTFEDECSKGGEDVISRISYLQIIRESRGKLRTRSFSRVILMYEWLGILFMNIGGMEILRKAKGKKRNLQNGQWK